MAIRDMLEREAAVSDSAGSLKLPAREAVVPPGSGRKTRYHA